MISLSKILVGVDLSHDDRLISDDLSVQCEQAVQKGIKLAGASGGELTFFTALDISEQAIHLIQLESGEEKCKIRMEAERVLGTLAARAQEAGVKTVNIVVAYGNSADTLIREVVQNNHSLVVIGRKSRSTFVQYLFGRTAVKLLRKCPVPVYVAKPDPTRPVESVLAADDFSETGEDVLNVAVQVARMFDLRLHVVHVVESGDDYKLAGSGITLEDLNKLHDEQTESAETMQADRLAQTDFRTIEAGAMVHIEKGTPEVVIAEKLREHEVDLLVIGTVGRSGLSAMFLGNTAERLLNELDCSLLAVKPRNFGSPIKA
ncbi:universal stress protein [Rubinisphaera margarita]|uniref:universal stress protein n=1 Tax=Rubinisphaera margarita TaxID=2909586 RepID=UPI001EE85BE3|nr:universal stress protein [Rubinisphaera margarita]MCG6155449.1 universal stress protein [Rubinisphaera margarita]